jgi:uncharacterized phiE125 gp8 family phage protein
MHSIASLYATTAPTGEPVTLDEAKLHCRVEVTTDDALISSLITAARQMIEAFTGRALITQTWQRYQDLFPCGIEICLEKPPLQSVTWVKYYDETGGLLTYDSSNYVVDTVSTPGRLVLKQDSAWPVTEFQRPNAVEVKFVAGYGNAAAVPEIFKLALKVQLAEWYDNRAPSDKLSVTVQALLRPYRVARF